MEPNLSEWEKLVHPEDMPYVTETLNKHFSGETEFYETVHRVKTKAGKWKWILDHGMVIQRDDKNQPVRTIGTHIDITKQKETEEKLKETIDTKNKLLSIVAHDLRGLISNFPPVLELLTGENNLDESTRNEFLEELKSASKSTLNLIENLLSWSRSQTDTITLKPTNFIINDLINDIIQLHCSYAKQKEVTISVINDKRLTVFADKDSISLILRNLLSNAIKFTPDNEKVIVSVRQNHNETEVEIADNGVGMKEETVNTLFKSSSFYSTHGTNNEKGSGLGLILCKDFVEKNGGSIRAESTQGKGSRFIFTIPV